MLINFILYCNYIYSSNKTISLYFVNSSNKKNRCGNFSSLFYSVSQASISAVGSFHIIFLLISLIINLVKVFI